jgi:hypothetical protein
MIVDSYLKVGLLSRRGKRSPKQSAQENATGRDHPICDLQSGSSHLKSQRRPDVPRRETARIESHDLKAALLCQRAKAPHSKILSMFDRE